MHFDRAKARERKSGMLLSSALRTVLAGGLLFLHFDRAKARERKSGTLLSSALRTVLAGGLLFCTEICDKM